MFKDDETIYKQLRNAISLPVSNANHYANSVREKLRADGLSLPVMATRLRSWAKQRGDVDRLVFGHNGALYTLAIQLKNASISCAVDAERELYELMPFRPLAELHIFTVGATESQSPMFSRPGTYEVDDLGSRPNSCAA